MAPLNGRFLVAAAAAAAAAFLPAALCLDGGDVELENADVVVVGGGLSGLWTAHQLQQRTKLKVVVLEGRGRVGGRVESLEPNTNNTIDLGGHWVGRTQYHLLAALKELGKETYKQWTTGTKILDIDGKVSFYNSSLPNLPLMQEANFALFALLAQGEIMALDREEPWKSPFAAHFDGQTVESFCGSFPWTKETKQLVQSAANAIMGKSLPEVSSLQFLHYAACVGGLLPLLDASPGGGQEFKVHGGTQAIAFALAKALDVRLNETVVSIDIQNMGIGGGAIVQTRSGKRFQAQRVVVAIPPHLAARIWYDPPLPSKKSHLYTQMTQGNLIKVFAVYKNAFWRERGLSGEIVSSTYPLSICYDDTTPGGKAALICFVGGSDAARMTPLTRAERQTAVTDALVRYFGDDASLVDEYIEKDWGLEPFTGGCPAGTLSGGALSLWGDTLRDQHGPVSFGGTETAAWWYGFMNGAIQAGERCAIETMEALNIPVPQEMMDFYAWGGKNKPPQAAHDIDLVV
mmetsp:Transcript_918/g.2055  ORF Transcript_918/g.2055 Transcript_918/m.2055 type:complete len:517 (+) Transcript_918:199-1749(+)